MAGEVGALNKEKVLVGAFSRHCETSRRFVDSTTQDPSGRWIWTDGRPFLPPSWAPGNPSGDGAVLELVRGEGGINDLPHTERRSAVCQQGAAL